MSALFAAFPKLEHLRIRGSNITLSPQTHENLRSLEIETDAVAPETLENLEHCRFPNLQFLGLSPEIADFAALLEKLRLS